MSLYSCPAPWVICSVSSDHLSSCLLLHLGPFCTDLGFKQCSQLFLAFAFLAQCISNDIFFFSCLKHCLQSPHLSFSPLASVLLSTYESGLIPWSLVNGLAARISVNELCAEARTWANRTWSPGAQMFFLGPSKCTGEVGMHWGLGDGT